MIIFVVCITYIIDILNQLLQISDCLLVIRWNLETSKTPFEPQARISELTSNKLYSKAYQISIWLNNKPAC